MIDSPRKVVSLLEILRRYADAYAKAGYVLGTISERIQAEPQSLRDPESLVSELIRIELSSFKKHCDDLPLTSRHIERILLGLAELPVHNLAGALSVRLKEVQSRLEDELQTKLFFQLPHERRKFFDAPRKGWEDILEFFPVATVDVEEMGKCFALSRYPACVFHSMQVVEHGVIRLGEVLRVRDPKPGWVATVNELRRILKKPHTDRTPWERGNLSFVEQMNATIEALMTAWRHKIDHVANRLFLLPGEFTPDIAEEIMMATKGFMRRLATEMPMEMRPEADV